MNKASLFIGDISALPGSGRPTGIFKHPVTTAVHLGSAGFAGDQQADRQVHGGPEKAVHLYPARHYERLAKAFPAVAGQLQAGSLGENISSPTLDETQVHIGQLFQLGEATLQVCQPRNPCWKIDERFASEGMAAFIAAANFQTKGDSPRQGQTGHLKFLRWRKSSNIMGINRPCTAVSDHPGYSQLDCLHWLLISAIAKVRFAPFRLASREVSLEQQ